MMCFAQSGFSSLPVIFIAAGSMKGETAFSTAGYDAQTGFNQLFRRGGSIDFHFVLRIV